MSYDGQATATGATTAATGNVLGSLPRRVAADCLAAVLARDPDLVALQEWGLRRRRLLPEGWTWYAPRYGGVVVGVRSDRYRVTGSRQHLLAGPGRADPGVRPVRVLPPRLAASLTATDRRTGATVTVIGYHLVPGSQSRGRYRQERPRIAARHRREVARLGEVVQRYLARGHQVVAMGDSNFDGLELPGLVSAWAGRRDDPRGTLTSSRKIDDVFADRPALSVELVRTASDHAAVVALRADAGGV